MRFIGGLANDSCPPATSRDAPYGGAASTARFLKMALHTGLRIGCCPASRRPVRAVPTIAYPMPAIKCLWVGHLSRRRSMSIPRGAERTCDRYRNKGSVKQIGTLHSMIPFAAWIAASSAFAQSITGGAPHGDPALTCRHMSGTHAHQTHEPAISADVERLNNGNPCLGDARSKGTGVDALATHDASTNTNDVDPKPPDLTFVCRFLSGPRENQTNNLAGIPGVVAVPIGSRCSDGTSSGTAVTGTAVSNKLQSWNGAITNVSASHQTGTICQFLSGPKAHGWHDYAPLPPVPVESSCEDGAGSVGFVSTKGHGDRY